VHRLKRQLPKQLKEEKERLCQLWNGNPAAQCVTIFNRLNLLNRLNRREESLQELADDTDRALSAASSHFEENFTDRYADLYSHRLVVRTTEIANDLAAQYPENAPLILQRLSQKDTEISRRFNDSIHDALAEGQEDQEEIRTNIKHLMEHSDRFRRLLTPGFLRHYGSYLFGSGAAYVLHELLPDLIKGPWIEIQTAKFAGRIFANFQSKRDLEFAKSFVKVLEGDLPALCEHMDTRVGQSLSAALDLYIEHKVKHERAVLNVLLELSDRKCDLESGISWFRNALVPDASTTPLNWSRSFAAAGVFVFIPAACAVWFYSPARNERPGNRAVSRNQEVPAIGGTSQGNTAGTLTGTGTMTSAAQSRPASAVLTTPVTPKPPELLQRPADTVTQNEVATNQRKRQASQSNSLKPISIRSGAMLDRLPCTTALILAAPTICAAFETVDWFGTQLLVNSSADLGEKSNQIRGGVNLHTGKSEPPVRWDPLPAASAPYSSRRDQFYGGKISEERFFERSTYCNGRPLLSNFTTVITMYSTGHAEVRTIAANAAISLARSRAASIRYSRPKL
jgi:hypothetical protein